jgi:glycosyltransferase involved in cell wall biosynthesis
MKVLHVMASGERGGGAQHILYLLPELEQMGIQVAAQVGSKGPLLSALQKLGIDTQPWQPWRFLNPYGWDILHYHGTRAAAFAYGQPRSCALKTVYTVHGSALNAQGHFLQRMVRFGAEYLACQHDAIISVCESDLQCLQQHGFLHHARHVVIGNAVQSITYPAAPHELRQMLWQHHSSLKPPMYWIGCIARLVPQKNLFLLANCLYHLPQQAHVFILGDGPERPVLAQHPMAKSGRLHLLGDMPNAAHYLPAFDVLALSSLWEGEPIVLLEAMAGCCPIVATAIPSVVDLAIQSRAIYLASPKDPRAFAAALLEVIHSPGIRQGLIEAGQCFVQQRTVRAQAEKIHTIYQEILS